MWAVFHDRRRLGTGHNGEQTIFTWREGGPCEEPKVKVDQKDTEGMNALMYAAEMGYYQVPWIVLAD